MNQRFSLYLDFLRFMAAMIVFVSHFAYVRFTDGDYLIIRHLNLGSDAVVFFFVLSGLVISYTAEVKDKTLKQYSFNRFTRLYSVIIPALFLTIILDYFGQSLAPENYDGWWYNDASMIEQLWRGLSLTSQWAGQNFRIGSNGPYWSLSYEAAYYILFGIACYVTGYKKYLFLIPFIIVFGLSVMLLFPAWLMGIWAYQQIKTNAMPYKYAWFCAVLPPFLYIIFLSLKIPKILFVVTNLALSPEFVTDYLSFSDEFIWNMIIAQLIVFHLIGVSTIMQKNVKTISATRSKIIKWCAGATFTIYIVHYPALQFMDAILPEIFIPIMRHVILFLSVIIFCFLFAEISERRLKWFRKKLMI